MTGHNRKHLTVSFEDSSLSGVPESMTNELLAPGAPPAEASSDPVLPSPIPFEPELESCPNDLPSFPALPAELKQALRAGRTPLIEGVDYLPALPRSVPVAPCERIEPAQAPEKPRVDTLSPSESVPPPAPYLAASVALRPSIVPPVRSPYVEPQNLRSPNDLVPKGIHSEPPPRIPISDRPSRIGYRSEPPPRIARSEPPPRAARSEPPAPLGAPVPSSRRKADPNLSLPDSPEAMRREAVTIQAETRPASHSGGMDTVKPSAALRVPTFSPAGLPYTMRQHENNQLRNVAMAMMFVIFIVTGAIAGIRWFVARENERVSQAAAKAKTPAVQGATPQPHQVPATIGATPPHVEALAEPTVEQTRTAQPVATGASITAVVSPPKAVAPPPSSAKDPLRTDGLADRDPWSQPSPKSKRQNGPSRPSKSAATVDTKTPLFSPRQ